LTLFPKAGGAMRYGIPNYRLPEERLDKDINDILEAGHHLQG
jgi:formate dehydrogenase beta subunit